MRRTKKKFIEYNGGRVEITRRTMKNMILRVGPGGLLKVSCPFQVPDKAVLTFIDSRKSWIDGQDIRTRNRISVTARLSPILEKSSI